MRKFVLLHCLFVLLICTSACASTIEITGVGVNPRVFTRDELRKMPNRVDRVVDGKTYTGVKIAQLLRDCGLDLDNVKGKDLAKTVTISGIDSYITTFALAEFIAKFHDVEAILADAVDGADLPAEIGPFRVLTMDRSGRARWVSKAARITLSAP